MKFKVGNLVRLTRELIYIKIKQRSPLDDLDINGFIITKIENGTIYREDNKRYGQGELELVPEEPEFEQGEMIEVSDDGKEWERRIFLYYIPNVPDKYLCVHKNYEGAYLQGGDRYDYQAWLYARKLKPQLTRKEIAEKFGVSEDFTLVD